MFFYSIKKHPWLVGSLWLGVAVSASAVTLGPHSRSATLGQPLDISVQAMLERTENPQALCLDTDVFYADRQLDKTQVQTTLESSGGTGSMIRIRATPPVEGPVVTLQLRAGCAQKTTRRYVVLAAAPSRAAGAEAQVTSVAAMASQPPVVPASPGGEKAQVLEAELGQIRQELLKSRAALAENQVQLEKAQNDREKALMYGLAGLLALALAGGVLALRRSGARSAGEGRPPEGLLSESMALEVAPSVRQKDADLNESLFDDLKRAVSRPPPDSIPSLPRQDRSRFSVSVPFVPRTVKVPELFDLQQQVEFFTSLGQQGKAISLLREHLVDNVKTSALVYLDLLDLYHQTGNVQDYEDLRSDFNGVFNTQVPSFHDYAPSATESAPYKVIQAQIQAVWPTRRVFDIIDDAMFREPGNPAEVLPLEAYQELLLVYVVAREITDLEPASSGSAAWPELSMQPRSSPRLGLDIDLDYVQGEAKTRRRNRGQTPADLAARNPRASTLPGGKPDVEPTVFDSLVDFDDFDTGFRPDGLGKSEA